jgi:hypothetical protein
MIRSILHFRWLLCLLLPVCLSGCTILLSPSFDAVDDDFNGPSYDGIDSKTLYTLNVLLAGMAGTGHQTTANTLTAPGNLLASADGLPGSTSPTDHDSFLDHVNYLYGIQLIGKGGKYFDGVGTTTSRRTYLEPLAYALYNYDLPNAKGRLFGGPGVFAAYGLWGKTKYSDPKFGDESYPAFDKTTGYQRFDAGLGFMVGYQLPQEIRLSITREWGLVNVEPGPDQC